MREYQKINTLFKRDLAGDKKLIVGEWATPEFEYLQNNPWIYTEKVDGTNIRVQFEREGEALFTSIGGRTDNADIPPALLDALNEQFLDEDLQQAIGVMMYERGLDNFVLHGEGYGPKIQGGGKYRDTPGFVLFDVRVGDWWLERDNVEKIASDYGIDIVPVVGVGSLHDAIVRVRDIGLTSTWGEFEAEGIVARPQVSMFNRKGERIIAKIKARDFR